MQHNTYSIPSTQLHILYTLYSIKINSCLRYWKSTINIQTQEDVSYKKINLNTCFDSMYGRSWCSLNRVCWLQKWQSKFVIRRTAFANTVYIFSCKHMSVDPPLTVQVEIFTVTHLRQKIFSHYVWQKIF